MSPKKAPMPSQDPNVRNKNFLEVATGYTEEVAIEEAQRCLNCKHRPCVNLILSKRLLRATLQALMM
jgi:glutamate synthase (NADPH/NADH) small chain